MRHQNPEVSNMNSKHRWIDQCPACGSEIKTSIKLWFKHDNWIYRCPYCRTIYVNPQPSDAELCQLYNSDYFQAGGFDSYGYKNYNELLKLKRLTFKRWLNELETFCKKGRLLEIGCADGLMLEIARERSWDVTGVEISQHAADKGRKKGLDIYCGTLQEHLPHLKNYDIVLMLDLFEHIPDPLDFLESVYKVLSPGGIVYIITPNTGSLSAKFFGVNWPHLKPKEHLCLFTKHSIHSLIERSSFELVKLSNSKKIMTFDHLMNELNDSIPIKFLKLFCKIFPMVRYQKLYLPLGEMRIVVKKYS